MNLECRVECASSYKSGSQIARVVTENWCARELYCPACDSDRLCASAANTPAVDFLCPDCDQPFQLKSVRKFGSKIVDAGYAAMIRAIRTNRTPNLLLLEYSSEWLVRNLLLIPSFFFTETIIERRNPLGVHARRAGWIGCNILLAKVPDDGRIPVVRDGFAVPPREVRERFSRTKDLGALPPSQRGWTLDVLGIVRRLGKSRFSLHELYAFENELQAGHPQNRNVRPKIRQQLQVLRDIGLVEFVSPGEYRFRT